MQQKGGDDRGAALVEFALLVPVLVMLVFGLVQFGIAFDRQHALTGAAREGARIASLPSTTQTQIQNRVTESLNGTTFDFTPTVTVTPTATKPCEGRTGETVLVTISVNNRIEIPFVTSSMITLNAKGSFLCE